MKPPMQPPIQLPDQWPGKVQTPATVVAADSVRTASAVSAAACALLGVAAPAAAADARWEVDTATMVYSETDRVSLVEPVLAARRLWDDHSLGARLTLDTLTGPSPNGATPASTTQTFTGPSGGGSYTAAPGEIPLDTSFKDTRVALALDYSAPVFGPWSAGYGVNVSNEFDYQSFGGSLRLQRDFNQHNTTLAFGSALAFDTINPVGGVPDPLSLFGAGEDDRRLAYKDDDDDDDEGEGGGGETKTVVDFLAGVTQVLDPHSLMRVNLVLSQVSGYQNDPYKIVSVVGSNGEPLRYVYESRPDSRIKTGIYTEYLRDIGGDVLRGSYRFMTDDWGIGSHTVELAYRFKFGDGNYVEPQLRYYQQGPADFYRVALFDGEEQTVSYVTADYRLGGMNAWTAGMQFGRRLQGGDDLSLRLGYYIQTPTEEGIPPQAAAGLAGLGTLVPETTAVMATVAYRFDL